MNAYFPPGIWYDLQLKPLRSTGQFVLLDTPITETNVFIRGGNIITSQLSKDATTTTEQRKGNFSLIVALDESNKASGELYWDDGDSLYTGMHGLLTHITFQAENVRKRKA